MVSIAASRLVDGISAFRQIDCVGGVCGMRIVSAAPDTNFDIVGGKFAGHSHGNAYQKYIRGAPAVRISDSDQENGMGVQSNND